jgi:peroxiredoxin
VLAVGDTAPDFMLADQNRQEVRLSQLRGRPVQIAFYVQALSGT